MSFSRCLNKGYQHVLLAMTQLKSVYHAFFLSLDQSLFYVIQFGIEILEWLGYPMVKNVW